MTIEKKQSNARMSQIVIHGETIYLSGQVGNAENDITFIIEDIQGISMEVKGFYYGKSNDADTKEFYGKLKAEF